LADASSEPATLARSRAPVACLRIGDAGHAERVEVPRAELADFQGQAWLPTSRAKKTLELIGLETPSAPDLSTLAQVNARPFATAVRASLAAESFDKHIALDLDTALAILARPTPLGWLVRRRFGAAGRGRRRLYAIQPPSPADLAWLTASLRTGPLVLEPWVQITTEFTRSGHVTRAGDVLVSAPCFQATTEAGAWTHTTSAGRGEVSAQDDQALAGALESAGRALAKSGYFGAFGIDAFRYRDNNGRERLNPLSEINARYTMDWALAMGAPRAEASRAHVETQP
jgi:hypothetical protein